MFITVRVCVIREQIEATLVAAEQWLVKRD
jgi:hypothetical protein